MNYESLQDYSHYGLQYGRFKMEAGDNKVEIELGKDRKSYAGIPEADFVVSVIYYNV